MSNKSQLQTNNNKLDALITRVNAAKDVAASLPEAGSGGGGSGSLETCQINLSVSGGVCSYINATGSGISQMGAGAAAITVPKNSIIIITGANGSLIQYSANAEQITRYGEMSTYYITGDCSFYYSDEPL